jgi:hypothetical protein
VLTVERQSRGSGFFVFRKLHLVVRSHGKVVVDRRLCTALRCGPGSHHSLALRDVWGDAAAEAVVDVYTGGAHCCFDVLVAFTNGSLRGKLVEHNFGDPGYSVVRRDGAAQFETADDRFAYAFTAFAASGLPVQVLALSPKGRFADVTSTRLDLVRKDIAQWWGAYVAERGKPNGDIRGVLAAWCADQYRLGQGPKCRAELERALRKGWAGKAGDIWPAGAKYVAAVQRSLHTWGYKG